MKRFIEAVLIALFAFELGYCTHSQKPQEVRVVERIDTTYITQHDTTFIKIERGVVRKDTVLLALVDTIHTNDSVLVQVPISTQEWEGEYYKITTQGYRVQLKDVYLNMPTYEKTTTITQTKVKHWNWGVGVQAGYGATIHGASPYVGVGVSFGYNF